MENKVKTQQELGAVHLEKKGLDKGRFKDLIKGHKVYCNGLDEALNSGGIFVENWYIGGGYVWLSASAPNPDSKLITLDELEEMLKGGKAEETKILKAGDKIELCGIDYEVRDVGDFYKEMRKAFTPSQHEVFDEIFGKDELECPYEDGELIFVKHAHSEEWSLRYSTGKMVNSWCAEFYKHQKPFSDSKSFCKFHAKAPNVKLPE